MAGLTRHLLSDIDKHSRKGDGGSLSAMTVEALGKSYSTTIS